MCFGCLLLIPPVAVGIISREEIYNLGWLGVCGGRGRRVNFFFFFKSLNVSDCAWGNGESSATGYTSI